MLVKGFTSRVRVWKTFVNSPLCPHLGVVWYLDSWYHSYMQKNLTGNATFKITAANGVVETITADCPLWDAEGFLTSSLETYFDLFLDFLPDEGKVELVSAWIS